MNGAPERGLWAEIMSGPPASGCSLDAALVADLFNDYPFPIVSRT
jgi:hypothetical protein